MWVRKSPEQLDFSECFLFVALLQIVEVYPLQHIKLVVALGLDLKDHSMSSLAQLLTHLKILPGAAYLL